MREKFQPTRPLPVNWLDLERYARELEARLTTTAGNVAELETRIAELEKRPCPNVVTSTEGTAYCRLAEAEGQNLRWARDQALKKAEEVSQNAAKEIAAVTRENCAMIDEVVELRRQLEAADQQRDENRESAFALAAHANKKIKRLREALTMVMASPAYCSCSPESGCKSAVAREAARAALAATESPAGSEADESEVSRG